MKTLVISYHDPLSEKVKGGFHDIYKAILNRNDVSKIDWLVCDLNLFRFALGKERKISLNRAIRLLNGISEENKTTIYSCIEVSLPKRFDLFGKDLFFFHPKLNKYKYDLIIVESVEALRFTKIQRLISNGCKVIYRPSDPLFAWSSKSEACDYEKLLVSKYKTAFVNESCRDAFDDIKESVVVYNCLDFKRSNIARGTINKEFVYIGAFPLCKVALNKLSRRFPDYKIKVYGPFRIGVINNIEYMGYLDYTRFYDVVSTASVFIVPYENKGKINCLLELTKKLLMVMDVGVPIVTMNCSPKVREFGICYSNDVDDFLEKVSVQKNLTSVKYQVPEIRGFNFFEKMIGNFFFDDNKI
ncbi:hypothetical protein K0I63_07075 [Shewanella rhizosphaerae]|uniref:hypothetical protein n=1 Tax=Shewanella rhizosphaerae TaxID=2864207 RepID=UPI001C65FFB1|nr:hypothetical protein [Shewanella rhizosphaerae]QYK14259.1 hypothetical protein K0I63_07075 [Shewanella rhizosphaerae]